MSERRSRATTGRCTVGGRPEPRTPPAARNRHGGPPRPSLDPSRCDSIRCSALPARGPGTQQLPTGVSAHSSVTSGSLLTATWPAPSVGARYGDCGLSADLLSPETELLTTPRGSLPDSHSCFDHETGRVSSVR